MILLIIEQDFTANLTAIRLMGARENRAPTLNPSLFDQRELAAVRAGGRKAAGTSTEMTVGKAATWTVVQASLAHT